MICLRSTVNWGRSALKFQKNAFEKGGGAWLHDKIIFVTTRFSWKPVCNAMGAAHTLISSLLIPIYHYPPNISANPYTDPTFLYTL